MFLCYGYGFIDKFGEYFLISLQKKEKRVSEFIIKIDDKTVIQIGNKNHYWLWFYIKPVNSSCLEYTFHFRG